MISFSCTFLVGGLVGALMHHQVRDGAVVDFEAVSWEETVEHELTSGGGARFDASTSSVGEPVSGFPVTRRLAMEAKSGPAPGEAAADALAGLVGDPIPWGSTSDLRTSEAAVVAVAEGIAEANAVELLSVDCASYPCISYFGGQLSTSSPWRDGHRVLLIDLPYSTRFGTEYATAAIDVPPDLALIDEAAFARAWHHLKELEKSSQ